MTLVRWPGQTLRELVRSPSDDQRAPLGAAGSTEHPVVEASMVVEALQTGEGDRKSLPNPGSEGLLSQHWPIGTNQRSTHVVQPFQG